MNQSTLNPPVPKLWKIYDLHGADGSDTFHPLWMRYIPRIFTYFNLPQVVTITSPTDPALQKVKFSQGRVHNTDLIILKKTLGDDKEGTVVERGTFVARHTPSQDASAEEHDRYWSNISTSYYGDGVVMIEVYDHDYEHEYGDGALRGYAFVPYQWMSSRVLGVIYGDDIHIGLEELDKQFKQCILYNNSDVVQDFHP